VATGGKDGTAGASAHPQAEAMGLGPAAVVRLEGALAHEVLRYCTAIRAVCAEGGAGQRMRQVRCSTSRSESMIGRNRRPAATNNSVKVPRAGENGRQHRPRSRYGSGYGTVKLGRCAISHATVKTSYPGPARPPCQGRHAVQRVIFWESPLDSSPSPGCCEGRLPCEASQPLLSSTSLCTVCG
jgi:hypothetical protein